MYYSFVKQKATKIVLAGLGVAITSLTVFVLMAFSSQVAFSQVTIPSGSTLTTDGEVYAPGELSPNQEQEVENLIASGEESGVVGTNLFVQIEDEIVVVPMDEIEGKEKEEIVEIFKSRAVEALKRNFEKNPEQASKGLQIALANQQQAIDEVASKGEKAAEKAVKAAEKGSNNGGKGKGKGKGNGGGKGKKNR